jgi:hypothetical protein
MSLARRFYNLLADVLYDAQELGAGASLLQTDRVMARRFHISESTARNWRRGKQGHIAPATSSSIIAICQQIAPNRVSDLEFIDRLSRGVHEVRAAAEALVTQLESLVLENGTSWHIYSGPLKIAFDTNIDVESRRQLLRRSSMIVDRIVEMGIDKADIPCISELIRYSMHGWYAGGLYKTRVSGLTSQNTGIYDGYLGAVEEALYIGDGCAVPCLISGDVNRARSFTEWALQLLNTATEEDARQAAISIRDAQIMISAIQVMIACHSDSQSDSEIITLFLKNYDNVTAADIDWVEATRQSALGYSELVRQRDYSKSAHHFEESDIFGDRWLAQFGIPFSSTSSQSLGGYALLMAEGPTLEVKSKISDGLIRTIDLGVVCHEVRARLCQARFYDRIGNMNMATFHIKRTQELVQRHSLHNWYEMLNRVIPP